MIIMKRLYIRHPQVIKKAIMNMSKLINKKKNFADHESKFLLKSINLGQTTNFVVTINISIEMSSFTWGPQVLKINF